AELDGTEIRVHEPPSPADTNTVLKAIAAHPGTPVVVTLAGGARLGQISLAQAILQTGAPVILVALREPYDLLPLANGDPKNPPPARGAAMLATYGSNPATLQAL